MAALKAVFDTCEWDARGGYSKGTALHFYGIPEELTRWLVEQGADINAEDTYGNTPLEQANQSPNDTPAVGFGCGYGSG